MAYLRWRERRLLRRERVGSVTCWMGREQRGRGDELVDVRSVVETRDMQTEHLELRSEIQAVLTPELVKKEYRHDRDDLGGHCYAASEAFFHMAGGREAGLRPHMKKSDDGSSHWWLVDGNGSVIEMLEERADHLEGYDYSAGGPRGFMTKGPSKRARDIIGRVEKVRAGTYAGTLRKSKSPRWSIVRRLRIAFGGRTPRR